MAYLDHDGHLAQLSDKLLGLSIIDAVLKDGCELPPVRDVPFSTLSWEDLAPLGKLVGGGNLGFLKRDTLVPNRQLVSARRCRSLVSVQKRLGPNLSKGMVEEAGRPVVSKEGIERLNVGINSELEGRIGGPVGWGISKKLLAAKRVVLVIPRRVCALGGHFRLSREWICDALRVRSSRLHLSGGGPFLTAIVLFPSHYRGIRKIGGGGGQDLEYRLEWE